MLINTVNVTFEALICKLYGEKVNGLGETGKLDHPKYLFNILLVLPLYIPFLWISVQIISITVVEKLLAFERSRVSASHG